MSNARLISQRSNLVDEVIDILFTTSPFDTSLLPTSREQSIGVDSRRSLSRLQRDGNDGTLDWSNAIVVFPGKRPAHVLRKKLSQRLNAAFIPPQIFSIDLFIDFLFTEQLRQTARTIDSLDAAAILFSLHQSLPADERLSEKHFTALDSFYPLAQKIYSELEELSIASVSPATLRNVSASVSLSSTNTLVALYEKFYQELEKKRLVTRSMKYRFTAEHSNEIDLTPYTSVILAGFYAFTPTEAAIVKKLLSFSNVYALFQNGIGIQQQLERVGLKLATEEESGEPRLHFYQSPDEHGQFFALNGVLKRNLPSMVEANDDSVIVLTSPENLFPLYHQTLAQYDQTKYNIALGYPLTRTPVYGFLMTMMDVIVSAREGSVFVPKYVQFLLHPYTKNILYRNRADVTRMVVHAVEEFCSKHNTRVFMKLEDIEQSPEITKLIGRRMKGEELLLSDEEIRKHLQHIHDVTLRRFFEIHTIGELGKTSVEVLQFINEHSTAHRHPFFRPFVETLMQHLEALQNSLLAPERFEKPERNFLFLKNYIAEAEVPFTGTPLQGLQVLGFLETRGLQFKNVYVLDANDNVIPGGIEQDVLLPLKVRQQLGLSTYKDQEQIKSYMFELLCAGAENVHLFFVENDSKIKSRFIEQFLWKEQQRTRSLESGTIEQLQYHVNLTMNKPSIIPKSKAVIDSLMEMPFSSTALDTYLTCPHQFYYRYVLHLYERSEISGDVEQSDIGTIIHEVLKEYFLPFRAKQLSEPDLDLKKLEEIVHAAFQRYYGKVLLGEQFFTKYQVLKHLREYVEKVQKPIAAAQTVIIQNLEEDLEAEISGFKFHGKTDRVETRNGKAYIVDYKTGADEKKVKIVFRKLDPDNRSTWNDAIGSVQLPLYMMMYAKSAGVNVNDIVPTIVFLGKRQLDEKTEFGLFESDQEAAEWYPKLEKILLSLVKEITDIQKPFLPTAEIENECPNCPYKYLCGTQWAEKFNYY